MLRNQRLKNRNPKIAVIGGGSWATAIVKILTDNNYRVKWWMRNPETIKYINTYHRNPRYLSSLQLNLKRCKVISNLKRTIRFSDILIVAIPAAFIDDAFSTCNPKVVRKRQIVSAIKGMTSDDNQIMSEYFSTKFELPKNNFFVLGGPSHAEEVARERLSYLTFAGQTNKSTKAIADLFANRYIKTSVSNDIIGIEYAEVLKNVIAVASGICHGLGYGDNFQSVLVSNAVQEISRFVEKIHPLAERDINKSVYLGDLLVTAYSQFSRNRTFGNMIGKGYTVKSAQVEMDMVAEGYYAVKSIYEINKKLGVKMPITNAVYNILYEKVAPGLEISILTDLLS